MSSNENVPANHSDKQLSVHEKKFVPPPPAGPPPAGAKTVPTGVKVAKSKKASKKKNKLEDVDPNFLEGNMGGEKSAKKQRKVVGPPPGPPPGSAMTTPIPTLNLGKLNTPANCGLAPSDPCSSMPPLPSSLPPPPPNSAASSVTRKRSR